MRLRSLPLCPVHLEVSLPDPGDRTVAGLALSVSVVCERRASFVRFHWHGGAPSGARRWPPGVPLSPGWLDPSLRMASLREAILDASRVVSADLREEDVSFFEGQLSDPAGLALSLSVMES